MNKQPYFINYYDGDCLYRQETITAPSKDIAIARFSRKHRGECFTLSTIESYSAFCKRIASYQKH